MKCSFTFNSSRTCSTYLSNLWMCNDATLVWRLLHYPTILIFRVKNLIKELQHCLVVLKRYYATFQVINSTFLWSNLNVTRQPALLLLFIFHVNKLAQKMVILETDICLFFMIITAILLLFLFIKFLKKREEKPLKIPV